MDRPEVILQDKGRAEDTRQDTAAAAAVIPQVMEVAAVVTPQVMAVAAVVIRQVMAVAAELQRDTVPVEE